MKSNDFDLFIRELNDRKKVIEFLRKENEDYRKVLSRIANVRTKSEAYRKWAKEALEGLVTGDEVDDKKNNDI